jgi:hypothetical protein
MKIATLLFLLVLMFGTHAALADDQPTGGDVKQIVSFEVNNDPVDLVFISSTGRVFPEEADDCFSEPQCRGTFEQFDQEGKVLHLGKTFPMAIQVRQALFTPSDGWDDGDGYTCTEPNKKTEPEKKT